MDADGFMKQAGMTAHDYMFAAVRSIDERFGAGYAAKHPELVGAFMQTAAADFQAMWLREGIDSMTEALYQKLDEIGMALDGSGRMATEEEATAYLKSIRS